MEDRITGQQESTQQPAEAAPRLRPRRAPEYLKTVLVTLLVALLLKTLVLEAFRIPSGSMEDTLLVGDFLIVNKLSYGLRTPRYLPLTNVAIPSFSFPPFKRVRRGDVIVFEYPGARSEERSPPSAPIGGTSTNGGLREEEESFNYIKRCIGLPGDTVAILAGRVFVNGVELLPPPRAKVDPVHSSQRRRSYRLYPPGAGYTEGYYGPIIVPRKGDVIALDAATIDRWRLFISREGHDVRVAEDGRVSIDGRESTHYTVKRNYYFVMGDNRGNSLDSRYWGFVPQDHLIGEALMVYWSWDPDIPLGDLGSKLGSIRWSRIGSLIR